MTRIFAKGITKSKREAAAATRWFPRFPSSNLPQTQAKSKIRNRKSKIPQRAFSLIEIVATLVLLGITGAFAGLMLSSTIQRFSLERDAAAMNQKTEIALARLVKELTWADPETVQITDSGRTIQWQTRHPDRISEGSQILSWSGTSGTDLLLQGKPLLDRVESFAIPDTVVAGYLSIHLQTAIHPASHQALIYLRNDI